MEHTFYCMQCKEWFRTLHPHMSLCPKCGGEYKEPLFSSKPYNPFTKDGKGFETKYMSKQEARERAKANVGYEE